MGGGGGGGGFGRSPGALIFFFREARNPIASLLGSLILGSLRYGDYGLRTTAERALSFVFSTGLSRANIER